MKREKVEIDEGLVCKEYKETNIGVESLALKYHVGKLKIKEILSKNGITLKGRGKQPLKDVFIVSDWKIEKYSEKYGYHYVAIDKENGYKTTDWKNKAGVLTTHIEKTYGIETPTLYDRRLYYMRTGNYWWEQWFDIVLEKDEDVKKCPYCEWTTTDIENMSGAFEQHLKKVHGISKSEYLNKFPDEKEYFKTANPVVQRQMEDDSDKYIICKECGMKLAWISPTHLKKHGMTKLDYIRKYPFEKRSCVDTSKRLSLNAIETNKKSKFHKSSNDEKELTDTIRKMGVEVRSDRTILDGMEIDIYLPEYKIGIEYNGDLWHTEKYGKDKNYHLFKTVKCNEKGVGLVQIFEDEYVLHKELVISKIRHMLNKDDGVRISGRRCDIRCINKKEAETFLNEYHIQGFVTSSVYIGAFYDDTLIGVMLFKNEGNGDWEMTRFASDYHYVCRGVGGKLFSFFRRNHDYKSIKSFADRRWTLDANDNIYVKLGFQIDGILPPDYSYYNQKVDKYKRFHKFLFRKHILSRKYGFPDTMTEREMTRELGYDRIWNCGLVKYVYRNETATV